VSGVDDAGSDEILVDARGHRCPTPTLKLGRAARAAAPGSIVRLIADDPLARIDVPHFAAEAGMEILGIETSGEAVTFRLRTP
jgi:tRNA 2-thiouridine synthesizing protein A